MVNDINSLENKINEIKCAQSEFAKFSQQQVDKIFKAVSMVANSNRIMFARLAALETGMGILEDKVIKNHFAAEYIYNAYKDTVTCGVFEQDVEAGITKIYEPIGVVSAIIPTTNPTSTAIFKILIALKTRNGIIVSPHPRAKKATIKVCEMLLEAAVLAGAPENIIGYIDEPSLELSQKVMELGDITLATGGPSMVKSAYSSGKPAIGVGAGNVPAIIDKTANLKMSVSSIIHSKTFDNGTICASEQSVIVDNSMYDEVLKEFELRGAYILNSSEMDNLRKILLTESGSMNPDIVGKSAYYIASLAKIEISKEKKLLIAQVSSTNLDDEPFAHEKLSPVLAMYKADDFDDALKKADDLVTQGGIGHTAALYTNDINNKIKFENKLKACRLVVNMPSSQGAIGDLYNFKLVPSLTLGCGTWSGNSVSENVGVKQLLNIKTVVERRENMLWFRSPDKIYFKKGCLELALNELGNVYNKKKAFIVTDKFLFESEFSKKITKYLDKMGITHITFFDVMPDPTLSTAEAGVKVMNEFKPDVIIALGGGSPMDAAKIMWLMYEHPDVDFKDLALRFADIRKRVYTFPKLRNKADLVCIPTTAGTGSEVTPFAIITDESDGNKYAIADYELMPTMAIVDVDLMLEQPKSLTAASGFDVLVHGIEGFTSMLASDFTDGLLLKAISNVFNYLPNAYEFGKDDLVAREKMANAACLAGMGFANSFLGLCHSMAHKLGAFHHLPHGYANALLLTEIMKYNSSSCPFKMGTFPQYEYPQTFERYVELATYLQITGSDNEKFDKLINMIDELKVKIGICATIKDFGIEEEDFLETLDEMVEAAFDDQCTSANPRYPLMSEIKEIYLKAYYGN